MLLNYVRYCRIQPQAKKLKCYKWPAHYQNYSLTICHLYLLSIMCVLHILWLQYTFFDILQWFSKFTFLAPRLVFFTSLVIIVSLFISNSSALDIGTWDLACDFNNTSHRTELNGTDRLIVRRGQPFTINLNLCSGSYEPGVHQLHIVAETGNII